MKKIKILTVFFMVGIIFFVTGCEPNQLLGDDSPEETIKEGYIEGYLYKDSTDGSYVITDTQLEDNVTPVNTASIKIKDHKKEYHPDDKGYFKTEKLLAGDREVSINIPQKYAFKKKIKVFDDKTVGITNKEKKEWTFLMYIQGKEGMVMHENVKWAVDRFAEANIQNVNFVVVAGFITNVEELEEDFANTEPKYKTVKYYMNQNEKFIIEESKDNMAYADYLENTLEWTTKNYPSDHLLVNFFSHGDGWYFDDVPQQNIMVDPIGSENYDYESFDVYELRPIFSKFDINIFSMTSCLMGDIETLSALQKDSADFVLASPSKSWSNEVYELPLDMIDYLRENKDVSPEELGKEYISSYKKIMTDKPSAKAFYEMQYIDEVENEVKKLSEMIGNLDNATFDKFEDDLRNTQPYVVNIAYKIEKRDAIQLMNKMINADYLNDDIKEQAQITKTALEKLVVDSTYIEGKDIGASYEDGGVEINYHNSKGLAIHAINSYRVRDKYQLTRFDKQTDWKSVLTRLEEYVNPLN